MPYGYAIQFSGPLTALTPPAASGMASDPTSSGSSWEYPSPQYVLESWQDEHKLCGDGISNVARGWLRVEWAVDLKDSKVRS